MFTVHTRVDAKDMQTSVSFQNGNNIINNLTYGESDTCEHTYIQIQLHIVGAWMARMASPVQFVMLCAVTGKSQMIAIWSACDE